VLLLLGGGGGDGVDGMDSHGGAHHHGDHAGSGDDLGHDQSWFLKLLSLQTLSGFATFFGLIGLTCTSAGWAPAVSLVAAVLAGVVAVWLVGKVMQAVSSLQSSGTLNLTNAIGHQARVYLRIPAGSAGQGRILLVIQGRNVECKAITRGPELANGAQVRVIAVHDEILEVEPLAADPR
jgi:membrane protein implicated in regulation of membrane protease activity